MANRTPCKNAHNPGEAHSTLLRLPGEAELKGRGPDNDEAKATKGRGNPLVRDSQPKRSHVSSSLIPGGWSEEGSGLYSCKVWGHRLGPAPWGVCAKAPASALSQL